MTKREFWIKHAPDFNFELDEDALLKAALERDFITEDDSGDYNYTDPTGSRS